MSKRKYTAQFKHDAAYQIMIKGVAVKELSERLDVPTSQLYRWKERTTLKSWRQAILVRLQAPSR